MINKYYVILLFVSALLFIVCKAFMSLIIWDSFSKGQYKKYKRESGFWERYFIVSTQRYVKDRYSKSEKRVINYTSIVKVLFYLNILLHLVFVIHFFGVLIFGFIDINDAIACDEMFSVLMGDMVEPRRDFISKNAKFVQNLDI